MPQISVIVPVYKVEAYLDRCVESILGQTFRDFELILVDDGSPDHCGAMCDEWAKKDSRIRVLHKANGGLSDARNVGVDHAKGEWITFIDSDDYVHHEMLQGLICAVQEHKTKVAVCGYTETRGEPLEARDLSANIWAPGDLYFQRNVNATVAWGKLYRADMVLPYPVGKLHEDEYVTYRILFACDRISVLDAALYGYFQNDVGITKSNWSPRRMDAWAALEQQVSFLLDIGDIKNARNRVSAWWANVSRQVKQIETGCKADEKQKYLHCCWKQQRRILKKYRILMGYNLMDHRHMYVAAWPRWESVFCIYCSAKGKANKILKKISRKSLGNKAS